MMTKHCNKCDRDLDTSQFAKNGRLLRSVCRQCDATRRKAARQSLSEHDYATGGVPEGYAIKGMSVLMDAEGKVKQQWVKSEVDKAQSRALFEEMVSAFCEPFRGTIEPVEPPEESDEDLLTVIPIGDLHVGLRCHAIETGEDWDTDATEQVFVGAVDDLLSVAPKTGEALIVNLGDYLHADSTKNGGSTTKGTPLDTDGPRFKVLLLAVRMFRRAIDMALVKAKRVTVICATGNHDGESSVWLRICLSLAYEAEPRVVIRTEPTTFHYFRFGLNLFGVAHSDTVKKADLPLMMAVDCPADWAATVHRMWLTGHIHHLTTLEKPGAVVRSFRSLASPDKWHKGQGYRSGRDLRLQVWHREKGQIQEFTHTVPGAINNE